MWALNGSYLPGPIILAEPKGRIFLPGNWGSSLSRGATSLPLGFSEDLGKTPWSIRHLSKRAPN